MSTLLLPFRFLRSQFTTLPLSTASLTNQTLLITGSNTGLGLSAARHLASLNPQKLILAVRSPAKGEAAKASILASTPTSAEIETWTLDMTSFESVIAFSKRIDSELPRLDAAILNAGISTECWRTCPESGWEETLQVNVLSTALLAILLLPKMALCAREYGINPRLEIVASDTHFLADMTKYGPDSYLLTMNDRAQFIPKNRYPLSKLLDVFIFRELSRIVTENVEKNNDGGDDDDGAKNKHQVIVTAVHPGFCHSDLWRDGSTAVADLFKKLIARSSEMGSRTLVHAVADVGVEAHGRYLADCKVASVSNYVNSPSGTAVQKKVWTEIVQLLGNYSEEVTKICRVKMK